MIKRILASLLLVIMLFASMSVTAAPGEAQTYTPIGEQLKGMGLLKDGAKHLMSIESVLYNKSNETLSVTIKNIKGDDIIGTLFIEGGNKGTEVVVPQDFGAEVEGKPFVTNNRIVNIQFTIPKGETVTIERNIASEDSEPKINIALEYYEYEKATSQEDIFYIYEENVLSGLTTKSEDSSDEGGFLDSIVNFLKQTGFYLTKENPGSLIMILVACVLLYLAIVKKFEPLLLLPIAFGMLLTNLMGADVFHEELFAGGHVHWDMFGSDSSITPGLIDILYLGVKLGIYPCLIFIGVGAMTDFGPLIANPKSLILGAAAQIGIFATFLAAISFFTPEQAASIGIIGGADGPTAIFLTSKLAPELLGPIAVAAYSYMALVPVIQPPIMRALTTKQERQIVMKELRPVSKTEKIVFPIIVTIFVALLVPSAAPLVGCLMLGNLIKESGVCERLSKTVQNELMNIVTIFLGVSVGATATASTFLQLKTLLIIAMGVVAFGVATACGVLIAKFMNLFLKNKINPLIGSAGVSAVPMAARVSQTVGQKENPSNFLLMHAMGPNVAGVIGSAIAAGALLAILG